MPSDAWEIAFTQVIVRNIAAAREDAGLTIEQFARRCDEVVGEPGRFKSNTMQGLFAGKRKNVTYAELIVFATALDLKLESLLLPVLTGELLPLPDGRELTVLEAWTHVSEVADKEAGERTTRIPKARVRSRLVRRAARQQAELYKTLRALGGLVLETSYSEPLITRARFGVTVCQNDLRELDRVGIQVNESDPIIAWCRSVDPDSLSDNEIVTMAEVIHGAPTDSPE
ncbi:hypothetical protein [Microbacterium paludicola]|uniref:hypothetical protein n=1 Tax=Microbacterium paludicola TaxID=300019 RepID=UPI0011A5D01A|nr:hypothetical protein [Microbacterium paludicola]